MYILIIMKAVSFTEFRRKASEILDEVEEGESVNVSRHGKVIARIIPATGSGAPSWKRGGLKLAVSGKPLSQTILEERRRGR